jgi:S-DNA-T family DNA segregation ATPase FtsK/SpoIIIE
MKPKLNLISTGTTTFIRRRTNEFVGMMVLSAGLILLAALCSYDPFDPSLSTAVSASARNFLGTPGSIFADLLLQWFGLGAFLLPVTMARYGLGLFRHRDVPGVLTILMQTLGLMVMTSCVFVLIQSNLSWQFAGTFGGISGYLLTQGIHNLTGIPLALLQTFSLVPWIVLFVYMVIKKVQAHLNKPKTPQARASFYDEESEFKADVEGESPYLAVPKSQTGQKLSAEKSAAKSPMSILKRPLPLFEPISEGVEGEVNEKTTKRGVKNIHTMEAKGLLPPLSLLQLPPSDKPVTIEHSVLQTQAQQLESVLDEFGIKGRIVQVRPGPVVTLFELEPSAGTKSSRVIGLADDIARSMCAISARVAIVPGRNVIGIELPNVDRQTVYLRELLSAPTYDQTKAALALALGKDIGGTPIVADLAKMPHLLLAGTTGSGKSVAVNTMILSLLFRLPPERCRFIMIDPKMLELSIYDGIPHLLAPVVTDPKKAVVALKWVVREMEDRYRAMSNLGVRNIEGYNQKLKEAKESAAVLTRRVQTGFDPESGKPIIENQPLDLIQLPYIVVVVDEMADLMLVAGKDIEAAVQRLAQMARAAGIHLIMATQRPSVDVITGTIKANFPCRVSFQVTSKIDSRTILGEQGAEQLLGQGDMLYMASAGRVMRVHGPFVSDKEVEMVVSSLKSMAPTQDQIDITAEDEDSDSGAGGRRERSELDPLFDEAVELICREKKASTSFIQRYFQIGYNRAARMMDQMEAQGIVGPANNVGRREILARVYNDE